MKALPKIICRPWPLIQARRHRKKRINKKWGKIYGFIPDYSVDEGAVFVLKTPALGPSEIANQVIVAYPKTYAAIKKHFERK